MPTRILPILLLTLAALSGCASHPRPDRIDAPSAADLDDAIRRGVDFLVGKQNPDGSWGSARRTKGLNISAAIPGDHRAFRAATTALALTALIETADPADQDACSAIERGQTWLLENLPDAKRGSPYTLYTVWAHSYGLHALAAMHNRLPAADPRQQRIAELVALQFHRLGQYQMVGGGWGYYDFDNHTARPGGNPTSFTTATVLVALRTAADAGFEPPAALVESGRREILRERRPDGSYLYSQSWWIRPTGTINQPGGALGRAQSCNAALRLWGDHDNVTDDAIAQWLDRLFARNGWLSIGRKRPVPHESYFAVAGYFYYYGHFYAGQCIDLLPPEQRPFYRAHLAHTLMALQESTGCWWDYPLYDYHQPYGTAFALMSLNRCREPVPIDKALAASRPSPSPRSATP